MMIPAESLRRSGIRSGIAGSPAHMAASFPNHLAVGVVGLGARVGTLLEPTAAVEGMLPVAAP